jgi:hypothetical protein
MPQHPGKGKNQKSQKSQKKSNTGRPTRAFSLQGDKRTVRNLYVAGQKDQARKVANKNNLDYNKIVREIKRRRK